MKRQHRASMRLTASVAALATLSTMGLVACSSGDDPASSTSGAAEPGGTSGEVAEITYLHRLPDGDGMTKVNDIVARWNEEHPGDRHEVRRRGR